MGLQELAMIVGGVLLLLAVMWVVNKVGNKSGASPKQ